MVTLFLAKVHLDLEDPENFDISPMDGFEHKISTPKIDPDLGHSAATYLEVGQESQFMITFSSDKAGIYKSCVRINVENNSYENLKCELNAEVKSLKNNLKWSY